MTTPTTVNVRLQLRADTAANWTAANPTLLANEVGLETDTKKLKVGNGSSAWNSLAYFPSIVSGGTVLGNLEIGTTGTLTFEGSTADGFETTLAVTNPTADRTITLPNQSGTVVVSGNASIVDADIAANAEIAVSKLADGAARQLLQTDAAGTGVEWTSNVDIPGTLDVTGAATFDGAVTVAGDLTVNGTTTNINTQNLVVEDKNIILGDVATPSDTTADGGGITLKGATDKTINWYDATDAWTSSERFSVPLGSAASPSLTFTGDENTGIYSPGADQVAISTGGSGRLFVDASGNVGVATSSPQALFDINGGFYRSVRYGNGGAIQLDGAGGTISSPAAINSSQLIGVVQARGYDGSSYRVGANITISTDGAVTSTSSPAYVSVATTPSGSTTPQERLRITSAGFVGIGTTSPTSRLDVAGYTKIGNYTGTFQGLSLQNNNDSSSAETVSFLDSLNNLGTIDSNIFFGHQTDGASYIALGTTPAGSRSSDRRVERVRITGSGNVGIGTASPQAVLHVERDQAAESGIFINNPNAGGYVAVRFGNSDRGTNGDHLVYGGTVLGLRSKTGTGITFEPAGSEKARLDSSGRLLVGTSSARGDHVFQIEGSNYELSSPRFTRFGDNAVSPGVVLAKTRGTTAGSNTIVNAEDRLGRLEFQGTDGTATRTAALIDVFVDGTPGTNDMPGRLVFSTTADGASSPTERMRIGNGGLTSIGGVYTFTTGNAANVNVDSSGYLQRSTSSIKYKTDVETLDDQYADALLACRPVWYRSTCEHDCSEHSYWGFIAEEVASIDPRLVHWKTTEITHDENGAAVSTPCTPEPEGVQYERFVPHLLNLIKRQKEQIEAMEARLSALESA